MLTNREMLKKPLLPELTESHIIREVLKGNNTQVAKRNHRVNLLLCKNWLD